jgi:ABC-2 type transport system permease protein
MRSSTVVVTLLIAGVIEIGLRSFIASGGAQGMAALAPLVQNPAVAALYGRVANLDNGGIFVVWKMGAFLLLTVAIWAALCATRLTRAHEDDGSWDVLVLGSSNRSSVLATTTMVLAEMGLVVGALSTLVLLAGAQTPLASAYFGLGVVATAWSGGVIGLLAAQVAAPRRSASQAAMVVIIVAFFVRVVADASASTEWLRDATFFGWVEKIGAFQAVDVAALIPSLLGPVLVAGVVWWLQGRRDAGGALWIHADSARPKTFLLGSTWTFAWRERSSVWRWWTLGLAAFGGILGYLTHALVSLATTDPGYVALLERWGFGAMVTGVGFIALSSVVMSVAFSFLVVSWISSAASDEVKGRLDVAFANGPRRISWLASVVASALLAVVVAAAATILAMWCGVRLSGTSMSISTVAEAVASSLGVVPFIVGGTMWLVGRVPRLTFAVGAVFVLVAYVVTALGPILKWPALLLESDPFHYLRAVPVQSFNLGGLAWLSALGVVIGATGLLRYVRRDVIG